MKSKCVGEYTTISGAESGKEKRSDDSDNMDVANLR